MVGKIDMDERRKQLIGRPMTAQQDFLARMDGVLGGRKQEARATLAIESSNAADPQAQQSKRYADMSVSEIAALVPSLFAAQGEDRAYSGIGSRETPPEICAAMNSIGGGLAERGFMLRSGGADGADLAFEQVSPGVAASETDRPREIYVPWKGFNLPDHLKSSDKRLFPGNGPDQREITARAQEIAKRAHPAWDRCSNGARSLHTRNVHQVMGMKLDSPVRFVVAWTKDGGPTGGTGQAIRIANELNIPVLNIYHPQIRDAVMKELGREREMAMEQTRPSTHLAQSRTEQASSGPKGFDFSVADRPQRVWDRHESVTFCKVREDNGILSNMHNGAGYTDKNGLHWKSTEAQYQAARYPHRPDIQEEIRAAPNAFVAKQVARQYEKETRPDWHDGVKVQMMAYVLSRKAEASKEYRDTLAAAGGRPVVEISSRDTYWGAVSHDGKLTGQNVLGGLHDQVGQGARMNELPKGTSFPTPAQAQELAKVAKAKEFTSGPKSSEPQFRASMYFSYGRSRRPGVESESTFDAIVAGERTSTTRFPQWGNYDSWSNMKAGDVVRFYEDKEMRGRHVDVRVTGVKEIDLKHCSPERLEEWSKVEGWSKEAGRNFGQRYGIGAQIGYEPIEGQAILKERQAARDDDMALLAAAASYKGRSFGR